MKKLCKRMDDWLRDTENNTEEFVKNVLAGMLFISISVIVIVLFSCFISRLITFLGGK